MTDEEIIEVVSVLKANDKTMKDNGISDNLWGKAVECITFLQFENAKLKSSLTHANEECLKWHERAQNLLKDSGGSISGYEKKISALQAENATLHKKLDKVLDVASQTYLDLCGNCCHEEEEPCVDGGNCYQCFKEYCLKQVEKELIEERIG